MPKGPKDEKGPADPIDLQLCVQGEAGDAT